MSMARNVAPARELYPFHKAKAGMNSPMPTGYNAPPPDGNGSDEHGFYVSGRQCTMNPAGYAYERDPS